MQVSDVMSVFAILTMSLRTGKAVTEVLPRSLVDRLYYHQSMIPHLPDEMDDTSENQDPTAPITVTSHHREVLTKDMFLSEEYAFYATGVAGAFQILSSLDEAHSLVADLTGEVPLRGFEDWRREFELRQLGERV